MEVLGMQKTWEIILGLIIQLSLMAFGFRIYFKGRRFWLTYVVISMIGMVTVTQLLYLMSQMLIFPRLVAFSNRVLDLMLIFMVAILVLVILYSFKQKKVRKQTFINNLNLENLLDQLDCLIMVYDKLGEKASAFGKLTAIDIGKDSFVSFNELIEWEKRYTIKPSENEEQRMINYQEAYLLIESTYLENKNGDSVGKIIIIRDVTKDQTIINRINETNQALEKANANLYESIEREIQFKKANHQHTMLTLINDVLIKEMKIISQEMTFVIDNSEVTLEEAYEAVGKMVDRTENIYKKLRDTINQLSTCEGDQNDSTIYC